MGIYSEDCNVDSESGIDMNALIEAYLIDDLTHNFGEKAIQNFCAPGGTGEALLEAKVLSTKRSLVRLSKQSDLNRRKIIAAIQMAKAKNDPLYTKLVKYQILRKQIRQRIVDKYGNMASRIAIKGQKQYIQTMRHVNLANSGSGAFLTKDPNR